MDNIPIIFVMGLSGAGKSTLGELVSTNLNFTHLEQDRPDNNGIDDEGLRRQWDIYIDNLDAKPLAEALRKKY